MNIFQKLRLRRWGELFLLALVGLGLFLAVRLAEWYTAFQFVSPQGDVGIEEWLDQWLRLWDGASVGFMLATMAIVIVWGLYGMFTTTIWWGKLVGKRRIWWGLFLIAISLNIVAVMLRPALQSGLVFLLIVAPIKAVLLFWLPTALFSLPSGKYWPFGAAAIRRGW